MTNRDFRRLALSFPATTENAHMSHPDFRVAGKIFATLGYPDAKWAMVKLTPGQQAEFLHAEPSVFFPVKGGWGGKGATNLKLRSAKAASVRSVLAAAWCNTAPKHLAKEFEANL
ncbi:MAG: MmcQ/YjbR family DNA-binding protein [Candidatus Acidiferrales bacterium]